MGDFDCTFDDSFSPFDDGISTSADDFSLNLSSDMSGALFTTQAAAMGADSQKLSDDASAFSFSSFDVSLDGDFVKTSGVSLEELFEEDLVTDEQSCVVISCNVCGNFHNIVDEKNIVTKCALCGSADYDII